MQTAKVTVYGSS